MEEKKKKNNLPLVVLVLALIAVAGYFVGPTIEKQFKKDKSPKEEFMTSIDKMFSETANVKLDDDEEIETLSTSFSIKANVTSSLLDQNLLNVINKLKLSGQFDIDKKNEIMSVNFAGTYNNSDLLDMKAYLENNTIYLYLNNIYDKWLKIDSDDEFNLDFSQINLDALNIDTSEFIKLFDEMVTSFKESLKEDYFTKEKDGDLNKITLTIDKNNIKDISESLVNSLKNSSKFKELYKTYTGSNFETDSSMIIESIKDTEFGDTFGTTTISVYIDSKDNVKKIVVTSKINDEKYGFEIEKTDDNTYEFVFKSNNISMISGSLKTVNKDDTTSITLKLSFMELIKAEINMNISIKVNEKLDKVDVSDSVNIEDLTDNEYDQILSKLENSKAMKQFLSDIEKIDFDKMFDMSDLEYDYSY